MSEHEVYEKWKTQRGSVEPVADFAQRVMSEIAEIEGVPEGTVKSRISRARETLLNALRNEIGMER